MLGEAGMYASQNHALNAAAVDPLGTASDPHDADPYGMHEERRRHP
jgi:hypothetical protein